MRHVYCDPRSKQIVCVTKAQLPAQDQGSRVRVDVADDHAAIRDPHRKITWQLNAAGDDLETTGQLASDTWENPAPTEVNEKLDRLAAAVRLLLGYPIP